MDARLQVAIDAFRTHERRRFSADKAEKEMHDAVTALAQSDDEELFNAYQRITQQIIDEYEVKREKAGL